MHAAVSYSCYICDVKFKHKKNIGRHLESTHGMKKCSYCMSLFKKGNDFDNHMLMCDAYKTISIT